MMNIGRVAPINENPKDSQKPNPLNESIVVEYDEKQSDDDDAFLQRMYVAGPCQAMSCSIEDQLDLFTHCRQPMQFLSFFREYDTEDGVDVEIMPAGMYVVPTFCEYCGAAHTSQCPPSCGRPKLYFSKKRPPFAKPDQEKWDPATDEFIPPPEKKPDESKRRSWVSGLFG